MKCFDKRTNVWYAVHEEWVEDAKPTPRALGFCTRCGEILDLALIKKLAARGHQRCQDVLRRNGIAYLTDAEKRAEAAIDQLTPAQRSDLLRRKSGQRLPYLI